jgi:hypothetical protein
MSRLLSGVENGKARIRRMGRLTSRFSLALAEQRAVQTRTEPPATSRMIPLIHEE